MDIPHSTIRIDESRNNAVSIASILKLQSFTKMLQRFLKLFNGDTPLMATRNPAIKPVEVGSLPHYLQGFIHPVRWLVGFLPSTNNSMLKEILYGWMGGGEGLLKFWVFFCWCHFEMEEDQWVYEDDILSLRDDLMIFDGCVESIEIWCCSAKISYNTSSLGFKWLNLSNSPSTVLWKVPLIKSIPKNSSLGSTKKCDLP